MNVAIHVDISQHEEPELNAEIAFKCPKCAVFPRIEAPVYCIEQCQTA